MNYLSKKILYINLEDQKFDLKSFPELHPFVGGLPLGLKIGEMYAEKKPLIFTIGPLNGFFPFVSKTCVLELHKGLKTFYLGGSLSSRMRFCAFDALVIEGKAENPLFIEIDPQGVSFYESHEAFENAGLPGRSSKIIFKEKVLLDGYFESPEGLLEKSLAKRFVVGIVINATVSYPIKNVLEYSKIFNDLLTRGLEIHKFARVGSFPSCVGCPLGCEKSKVGEKEGNILAHSLVACDFMSDLYSDVGVVFSCLNILGYDYKHEDLERLPSVVADLLESLDKKI